MKKYKFWSVYRSGDKRCWLCIPPSKEYLPEGYPENAVRKHKETILPPPSYWLEPEYEDIVYQYR
jgi:hypothetical protein